MAIAAGETGTQDKIGLRTSALGFPAVLAQSIALISPTMTAVLIIPLAFSNAGEGTFIPAPRRPGGPASSPASCG